MIAPLPLSVYILTIVVEVLVRWALFNFLFAQFEVCPIETLYLLRYRAVSTPS